MSDFELDEDPGMSSVRELSKSQRRCLGVLIEKAFTTPEYYPMTLKAATNGCNQKSNRDPVTNYSEDAVWQTMDELRELKLIVVIETETGRTERYRHMVRKRFPFSEPQLAIMTELWLRGRQSLGELRARASRMVPIEGLHDLRRELQELLDQGFVQASGALERRGIEVDHNFYSPSEGMKLAMTASDEAEADTTAAPPKPASAAPAPKLATGATAAAGATSAAAVSAGVDLEEVRAQQQEFQSELQDLRQMIAELRDSLDDLRQSLGA